jgi:YrbI family 3-deoxy-D-manno-octulosonate 8-phosphate phosphatase
LLKDLKTEIVDLVKQIKFVIFDFDGVFTDNRVYVSQDGSESVSCCRSDGLGLRRLDDVGIQYCIVSTETNPIVTMRAKKLNIPVTQGHDDKLSVVRRLVAEKGFEMSNVAYVGNDINDKQCLEEVGLPIVVADAYPEVISISQYQTQRLGGHGAVREVCDLISKYHITNKEKEL